MCRLLLLGIIYASWLQEVGGAFAAACECNGGCPYKTYDQQQLRTALSRLNCNDR